MPRRAQVRDNISERDFQQLVLDTAKIYRWRVYHTFDSRRSQAGFPDLVLVKGRQIIFAELKSEKGKISDEQNAWLGALAYAAYPANAYVHVAVWRPSDFDKIVETLR